MPVCIAGMHRSGTSMVTKLLRSGGLWLGEEDQLMPALPDNQDGFWEHIGFVALNDEILESLGGWWDYPPPDVPDGWDQRELRRLQPQVQELADSFAGREPWGWKDPRTSLTLPLWRRVWPELKVVICLRNPLEVAVSLRKRNTFSYPLSLNLWLAYNRRLLAAAPPDRRLITHYDAFFGEDARGETRRLLQFAGLDASDAAAKGCLAAAVSGDLRHSRLKMQDLIDADAPAELIELYLQMCVEAGWIGDGAARPAAGGAPAFAEAPRTDSRAASSSRAGGETGPSSMLGAARIDRLALARQEANELREEVAQIRGQLEAAENRLASAEQQCDARQREREQIIADYQRERQELTSRAERELRAMAEEAERQRQAIAADAARELRSMAEEAERQRQAVAADAARELQAMSAEAEHQRRQILESGDRERAALEARIDELSATLAQQSELLQETAARATLFEQREPALRQMLLQAHQQILDYEQQLRYAIEANGVGSGTPSQPVTEAEADAAAKKLAYRTMVDRIRQSVKNAVPRDAWLAVISKGDDSLLDLGGRRASHFLQNDAGEYAGYTPADDQHAASQLDEMIKKGVTHLLVPSPAFWWRDFYPAFASGLETRGRGRIVADADCIVYDLTAPAVSPARTKPARAGASSGQQRKNGAGRLRKSASRRS